MLPVVEVAAITAFSPEQTKSDKDTSPTSQAGTANPPLQKEQISTHNSDPALIRSTSRTEILNEPWLLYDEALKFSTDDGTITERTFIPTVTNITALAPADDEETEPELLRIRTCTEAPAEVDNTETHSQSPPERRLQRQLDHLTDAQFEQLFSKLSKILYKDEEDWEAREQPDLLQEILNHPSEFFNEDGQLFCAT
jgi:hypothetical protein